MQNCLSSKYTNDFKGLPNFFDFIEADINTIFGNKGFFILLNIFNLSKINEEYGIDIGDISIKCVIDSVNSVVIRYKYIYGFRFGSNDFIITLPGYEKSMVNKITTEVEEEFKKEISKLSFSNIKLNNCILEYNHQISDIENFYELLFNNANSFDETKNNSRLIRHIVHTFTNNIKNTLSSYNTANNLAYTDDITGIPNHRAGRYFINNLVEEYSYNNGFAVLFIDGDNLKRYNNISYEAGNNMIKSLSQIISNSIRHEDKVFRWLSGDEFLVVLKGADEKNSLKLAERIREEVEKQTLSCIFPTTISIGVSHYPSDGNAIEEIINKAEKANSYAKFTGRNKVIRWNASLHDKR